MKIIAFVCDIREGFSLRYHTIKVYTEGIHGTVKTNYIVKCECCKLHTDGECNCRPHKIVQKCKYHK